MGVLRAELGNVCITQTYNVRGYDTTRRVLLSCAMGDARRVINRLDRLRCATVKKSPPTFVQAGPMDPWALMQKALLDALVLQESALFQAEHAHAAQDQCPPGA